MQSRGHSVKPNIIIYLINIIDNFLKKYYILICKNINRYMNTFWPLIEFLYYILSVMDVNCESVNCHLINFLFGELIC